MYRLRFNIALQVAPGRTRTALARAHPRVGSASREKLAGEKVASVVERAKVEQPYHHELAVESMSLAK